MFAALRSSASPDRLWRMSREGHHAECVVQPTPVGLEGQFLIDGRVLVAYQFCTRLEALAWAHDKFHDLRTRGWIARTHFLRADRAQQSALQTVA